MAKQIARHFSQVMPVGTSVCAAVYGFACVCMRVCVCVCVGVHKYVTLFTQASRMNYLRLYKVTHPNKTSASQTRALLCVSLVLQMSVICQPIISQYYRLSPLVVLIEIVDIIARLQTVQ